MDLYNEEKLDRKIIQIILQVQFIILDLLAP